MNPPKQEYVYGVPVGYAPVDVPARPPPPPAGGWSTRLCHCGDENCGICCLSCWCPCIAFGRIAEIVDQGTPSCGTSGTIYALLMLFTGCHWVYSCVYRRRMRARLGLPEPPEAPCNDCATHFFCEPCALTQEYLELTSRGFDVALGWPRDGQLWAGGAPMQPPPMQEMGCRR